MAQNIYDDPDFLAAYSQLDRQVRGLAGAGEWPSMRAMLPDVSGARILDLGCGFGWFARWACDHGAASVVGVDLSEKMLARAVADTPASAPIEYRRDDLDAIDLDVACYDIVFSSLAIHYVVDLPRLLGQVFASLRPGGAFVFSVEHPIYSAPSSQAFERSDAGRLVWPLENYLVEGQRSSNWFADGVIKQHRTIGTHVNRLIEAGFVIDHLEEWGPTPAQIDANPEWADDLHRPWFLLIAATRPAGS